MKYEILSGTAVINTIEADEAFMVTAHPDGNYRVVIEAPTTPTPKARHITRLAFRNRFTNSEKVTMEIASLDNPSATMAVRQQAAALRVVMKDQENATFIDLDRPDTRAGVQMLEAGGLLGVGRALAILDTAITDAEQAR